MTSKRPRRTSTKNARSSTDACVSLNSPQSALPQNTSVIDRALITAAPTHERACSALSSSA
jgi:hypothetical protein